MAIPKTCLIHTSEHVSPTAARYNAEHDWMSFVAIATRPETIVRLLLAQVETREAKRIHRGDFGMAVWDDPFFGPACRLVDFGAALGMQDGAEGTYRFTQWHQMPRNRNIPVWWMRPAYGGPPTAMCMPEDLISHLKHQDVAPAKAELYKKPKGRRPLVRSDYAHHHAIEAVKYIESRDWPALRAAHPGGKVSHLYARDMRPEGRLDAQSYLGGEALRAAGRPAASQYPPMPPPVDYAAVEGVPAPTKPSPYGPPADDNPFAAALAALGRKS